MLVQTVEVGPYKAAHTYMCWVLPPLSNSWIISIIWLYIALNRTPNIDCYWGGAVPNACVRFGHLTVEEAWPSSSEDPLCLPYCLDPKNLSPKA